MGFEFTCEDIKTSVTKNGQPSYHFHKMDQTAQLRLGVTPNRSVNRWGSESISFNFRGNRHSTVSPHNIDRLAWKGQLMLNEQWYDDITLISELKKFPNGSEKNVIVTLWKDGQIEDKPTISCCDDLITAAMEGHPLDPKIVTTELHQAFCNFSEEIEGDDFLPTIWLIEQQRVLSKEIKTLKQANSSAAELHFPGGGGDRSSDEETAIHDNTTAAAPTTTVSSSPASASASTSSNGSVDSTKATVTKQPSEANPADQADDVKLKPLWQCRLEDMRLRQGLAEELIRREAPLPPPPRTELPVRMHRQVVAGEEDWSKDFAEETFVAFDDDIFGRREI